MATMRALTHTGDSAAVTTVPNHPVRAQYVKIKVAAVALNPTDWKHIRRLNSEGAIAGMDIAGTVVEVGSAVTTPVKVGDRIAGPVHGGNASSHRDGGFAEQAEIKDGLFAHVPAAVDFASAATLGCAVITIGQGLFRSLGLKLPSADAPAPAADANSPWLLIYGAASATGSIAVQYAALAGARVIVTASAQHHGWLRERGAQLCFDYHDADVGAKIREATHDSLHLAFDTITNEQSMAICCAALASAPTENEQNHYSGLLALKDFPRDDCNARSTMAYTTTGETFVKGGKTTEAIPEEYQFAKRVWALTDKLLQQGRLQPHPMDKRSGGLDGIMGGLKDLEDGNVSGKKIVYEL